MHLMTKIKNILENFNVDIEKKLIGICDLFFDDTFKWMCFIKE